MIRNIVSIRSAWTLDDAGEAAFLLFCKRAYFYRQLYLTGRLNEGDA